MASLFKFGAKEHMEQFLEEGHLYMNTLKWFSEVEDGGVRGDPNEGLVGWWQGSLVTLHFGDIVIDDALSVRLHSEERQRVNVFCMYRYGLQSAWVDPRNHRPGDLCAVIHNRAAFMERVDAAFKAQSPFKHLEAGSVRYVDQQIHHGEVSPFEKTLGYSYQHEFRIALSPGLGDPYSFRVGDLTDIGFLMPAGKVNRIPMHVNLLPPKR